MRWGWGVGSTWGEEEKRRREAGGEGRERGGEGGEGGGAEGGRDDDDVHTQFPTLSSILSFCYQKSSD